MNRVTLVGNLGKAPQVRELTTGRVVAKISLATTEVFRGREGEVKAETQWHTVLFWGPMARLVEKYLRKGSLVLVEGRIRYRWYEEEGGGRRYVTEIVADRILMLDKPVAGKTGEPEIEDLLRDDDDPPF